MKFVVDHMLAVEETTSGVNIMKRKRFTLVKVIDEKLDELAASVLAAQKEQLGSSPRSTRSTGCSWTWYPDTTARERHTA